MSTDVSDVLEEHERNEIRGTLLGVSRMTTVRVAQRSVDLVDPYTREVRLWVHKDMTTAEIKQAMLDKLGMAPMIEDDDSLTFEIKYGSKYSRIRINMAPFETEFS